jgi:hypothetical protein
LAETYTEHFEFSGSVDYILLQKYGDSVAGRAQAYAFNSVVEGLQL